MQVGIQLSIKLPALFTMIVLAVDHLKANIQMINEANDSKLETA
jgi:hypothetical protein